LHSNDAGDVSARWFGIEIAFPPDASELSVGSDAHVIYLALRKSGLAWSARSSEAMPAGAARSNKADALTELLEF
jgi:hypothetical protein